MSNPVSWFVHRPLLVNLIMAVVFILGFFTIADLRYEYNPKVDLGVVNISTVRTGAGPEEIELGITLPLEEELLEVEGIKKLYSNSMENVSLLTLQLDLDAAGKSKIMRDIQRAVDRATTRLPNDLLEKPRVEEISSLLTPIMDVHVTGDVSEERLREVARNVSDGLREVQGVASVTRVGYRRPEVLIQLAPEKLARLGITHDEIIHAIRARNLRLSGGSVDSFLAEKKVVAIGQFDDPKEVREVVIRAGEPGNHVLLSDVATILLGFEDWEVQSRVDGRMSIALQVLKKELSDEVHTAAAVREFIRTRQLPPGVELVMTADVSRLTTSILDMLTANALLGLVCVALLLYYFLHLRFAIWVAVGIPFSICLSFLLLSAVGVTMNAMSLTAIILMLGILVDDAVVVSENTKRLRQEGIAPVPASITAATQVAQPVIFSAITTMLAFTPLMFLGGSSGEFMTPFPMAVIVLLLASLFECLFLLPTHLAHVPAHIQPPERPGFARVREAYTRFIKRCLKRRWVTTGVFFAVFVVVMALGAATIPFSLFPDIDIDTVQVKVEMPPGTPFEQTLTAVEALEGELKDRVPAQDLLAITSGIGHHDTDFYGSTEGRNHAWALISVQLHPLGHRPADTNTYELVQSLQQWADSKTGFHRLDVQAMTDMPVTGKPVEVEVISSGEERYQVAREIEHWLQDHEAIDNHWSSYSPGKDVIDLDIDHALLASRGLTVAQLTQALSVAVDGLLVDELQTLDERVRYRLSLPPQRAAQLETLRNLVIVNDRGEPIYLNAVAGFRLRPGEANIKHYFGKRTVTVYATIDTRKGGVAQVNAELGRWIADQGWSGRYPGLRIQQGGELIDTEDALGDFSRASLICLISIFAALIILFNSLSQPLLIMLCIPFGMVGVVLCYMVQGLSMGMMSMAGIIGLIGVLVNDSLVLLYSLNRERKEHGQGLNAEQVAAVARRRFRPIVITSVTTAVGLMPTAYGIMGDNSYIRPMVMSMAWGVVFGGVVSLVLLPVLYMLEQDVRAFFSRRLKPAS